MRRYLNILFLVLALSVACVPNRVQAMDPVTIAILAPIAIKAAQAARPYIVRGLINLGKGFVKILKSAFGLVFLPYGLGKMMFACVKFATFPSVLVLNKKEVFISHDILIDNCF